MKLMKLALPLLVIFSLIMITACDDRSMELPKYEIVKMTATPDTIYADNNITYSEIEVIVKDSDGFAVTNEEVTFSTNIGNMIYKVNTDSAGVATSTFWDAGQVGTAVINAFVGDIVKKDTVYVIETPEVTALHLVINSTELNVDELIEIKAVAQNAAGYVPNGTMVAFVCDGGYFTDIEGIDLGSTTQAATNNGSARTYYHAGSQSGIATVTATIGEVSDSATFTVHPGSPKFMYLDPSATEVQANSGDTVNILAQVEDKHHNPVNGGILVEFSTNIGSVTQFASTNEIGIASADFSAGVEAGSAQVEAVADSAMGSVVINVISDDVNAIEFVNDGQIAIDVIGTGGNESAALRVALKDMNDNTVDGDYMVHFELIEYPEGVNINNVGISDSVMSVDGEAVVSINSGNKSGNVAVRAYTTNNAGIVISSTMNRIIVQAGPPSSVEFTMAGVNEGENIGGGAWRVQIGALITDEWNNPVKEGTTVFFSIVNPDEVNPIQYASIETETAYVGNFNADQDSIPGMAYSYLTYDGAHTNDLITVKLEIGDFNDTDEFALPLQQGFLDVVAVPFHFEWTEDNNPEFKDIELRIMLRDGQNNLINGQVISFETSAGTPLEPIPADTGDAYTGLTGVGTLPPYVGENGILYKYARCMRYEFPEPGPAGATPVQVQFNIKILGTDVETQVTVTLTRYI